MGRGNPNTYVANPAKFTVNWSGDSGEFYIYDKEKKERVTLDLPFRFAWVETLAGITGYNEDGKYFIRSNEVRNTKNDDLEVFHFESRGDKFVKIVDHQGLYNDIKPDVTSRSYGGRYTSIVYGVADGDNGPIKNGDILRIEIAGAALNAWIDKGFSQYDGCVCVEESKQGKKGRVEFFQPIFKQEQISGELDAIAVDADRMVSAWVDQDVIPDEDAGEGFEEEEEDDIPF